MEVTLDDLLVLEPRLAWRADEIDPSARQAEERRVVSWIVSARTTAPHLPLLRGGEVVLVSSRVTAVVGRDLPALLREATLRDVAAVVFQRGERGSASLDATGNVVPMLVWDGDLTAETETSINRLLTECRGNLYRVGTELERQMTDLAASRAGLSELVRTASELSGLPMCVTDSQGRLLSASHQEFDASDGAAPLAEQPRIERKLASGLSLILGPLRPEQRVVAQFLVDRIATAAAVAARQDEAARPRGARRVEAVEALVSGRSGVSSERRQAALALGLDPDAIFFVAVSSEDDDAALTHALAPLGTVHAAGLVSGRRTSLVAANVRPGPEILLNRVAAAKKRWHNETEEAGSTLAISAPASGIDLVPAAANEARFIAALQAQARFPPRAASFDSIDDIGAFQLLYPLRDRSELRQFISRALGILDQRDHRGTLRDTLRAYLESGGSHADASHRLGIHRNTLAYRLRRIGELVGRNVGDPNTWLTLQLALMAAELLELEVDPDE
jgi:PucR family transcriptional regulator, purine catabolism regulatory protein